MTPDMSPGGRSCHVTAEQAMALELRLFDED